jgi:hypothetical protein
MDSKMIFELAVHILELALVFLFLPVLAILLLFGRIGNRGSARVIDSRVEFPPCQVAFWSWLAVIALLLSVAVLHLVHHHEHRRDLLMHISLGVGALLFLSLLPATIVVTEEGLEQIFWLGKNRKIAWDDIDEVNTGKDRRTVSITGRDGTRILHMGQLVDRPRLLLELKQHCGEDLPPDFPCEPLDKR